jgi:hypothetical protein
VVLTVFRFCIETELARAITPLSCVALWVLWHVCVYVRVRKWGCGIGSILKATRYYCIALEYQLLVAYYYSFIRCFFLHIRVAWTIMT